MIFIRPKILRTAAQTAVETGAKYNYMLDEQHKADKRDGAPLLPDEKQPSLPPLPAMPPPEKLLAPQTSKPEVPGAAGSAPAIPSGAELPAAPRPQQN
jgi:hypothetical protein